MKPLHRAIISLRAVLDTSHKLVALRKVSSHEHDIEPDNLWQSVYFWNPMTLFSLPLTCTDPALWITKEQPVNSTEDHKSDFPLFSTPSASPGKIMWPPSQSLQCVGVRDVLGYFYFLGLFGFYTNNLIHLTFPPLLDMIHQICLTLY